MNNSIIWRLLLLLLCCFKARGDWALDFAAWKDVPESIMTIETPPNLEIPLESDWFFNLSIPKPPFQLRKVENGSYHSIQDIMTFHVEKTALSSYSPYGSSILHEIGNLLPLSLDFVMKSLYWPLDIPEPKRELDDQPWLLVRFFRKIERIKSRIGEILERYLGPVVVRVSPMIKSRAGFPPPRVDRINIIIDEDGNQQNYLTSVARTVPLDPENPFERTIHLDLDWLESSMLNPLPWQTPEVRRLVLMEILTHELSAIYQHTGVVDGFTNKKKHYQPPPLVLLRGISKFVTLQHGLSWTGVKTPDQLEEIPAVWNIDSEHLAYFFLWIENVKYGRGSIASLNHQLSKQYYWSRGGPGWLSGGDNGEAFWRDFFEGSPAFGKQTGDITADKLWSEYLVYVGKEGYLSPFKWIHYSLRSIKTAPQGTVRWISRIWSMLWRKIGYWKRVARTDFHLQVIVPWRDLGATIMPWVTPFVLLIVTTIGYKIGYERTFLTPIHIDNGEPWTLVTVIKSLFRTGVLQSWHGIKMFASGIGIIWSGFCFPIWHYGLALIARIDTRLQRALFWILSDIPSWILGHFIDSTSWAMKKLLVIAGYLLEIPFFCLTAWVAFNVFILSTFLDIVSLIFTWPLSFFYRSETDTNARELETNDEDDDDDDSSSDGSSPPGSPSEPNHDHPPQANHNTSSPLPSSYIPPAPGPYYAPVVKPVFTITRPSAPTTVYDRSASPSVESDILGTKEEEEEVEDEEMIAEEIFRSRLYGSILKYRVKWRGMPPDQKWYNARELRMQPDLLQNFHAQNPDQAGPPVRLSDWFQAARDGVSPKIHSDDNSARVLPYIPSRRRH